MAFEQAKPPFFLVWNLVTGFTRKQHGTIESAEKEAQRLADLDPTGRFFVLVGLGLCRPEKAVEQQGPVDL